MNIITDNVVLVATLHELIRKAKELHWAIAWATSHCDVFGVMKKEHAKIRRLIVGTHFYQTDPVFMRAFYRDTRVRFVLKPSGIFHPKVYLFKHSGETWDCLVGSANLTAGGMSDNAECMAHFTQKDNNAAYCLQRIQDAIEGYWNLGRPLSHQDVAAYERRWIKKSQQRDRVAEGFIRKGIQIGRPTLEIPILCMEWTDFVRQVRKEDNGESMADRLAVLEELRNLFHRHPHFCGMPPEDQLKVAGLLKDQEPNYQWFGSMWGAGHFKHAIKVNDPAVSTALDAIPLRGPVDRAAYNRFVNTLRRAFPKGGMNVGVVSRLLAMKRPDLFVCLDKKNKQKLTEAFAIPKSVDCDDYWDCIVQRIQDSTWWQTSRPEVADQKRIWDGRAAMLDALFYQR